MFLDKNSWESIFATIFLQQYFANAIIINNKENISTRPGQYTATAQAKMFISQQTHEGLQITAHSTVEVVKFLLSHGLNS